MDFHEINNFIVNVVCVLLSGLLGYYFAKKSYIDSIFYEKYSYQLFKKMKETYYYLNSIRRINKLAKLTNISSPQ